MKCSQSPTALVRATTDAKCSRNLGLPISSVKTPRRVPHPDRNAPAPHLASRQIDRAPRIHFAAHGHHKAHAAKMPVVKMNIQQATRSYEAWMRSCTTVIEGDLRSKHAQLRDDPFLFFRGTFYRWAQLWSDVCPDLRTAPKVLAAGDRARRQLRHLVRIGGAHVLGRVDLVRLAASVKMGIDAEKLNVKLKDACDAIVEG